MANDYATEFFEALSQIDDEFGYTVVKMEYDEYMRMKMLELFNEEMEVEDVNYQPVG